MKTSDLLSKSAQRIGMELDRCKRQGFDESARDAIKQMAQHIESVDTYAAGPTYRIAELVGFVLQNGKHCDEDVWTEMRHRQLDRIKRAAWVRYSNGD